MGRLKSHPARLNEDMSRNPAPSTKTAIISSQYFVISVLFLQYVYYRLFLLSHFWARQFSRNVSPTTGFLCDEVALPRDKIKGTFFTWDIRSREWRDSCVTYLSTCLLARRNATGPERMRLKAAMASACDIPWRASPFTARISSPTK